MREGATMSLDQYTTPYVAGFSVPSMRSPANKSRKSTHRTTVRDQGECGPVIDLEIEYTARHTPACNDLEIDLGCVVWIYGVKLIPVYYGDRSVVLCHPAIEVPYVTSHWIQAASVILNEHVAICERIEQEIREAILAE
jgi:hypothetical protein